jgi:peptide/nickel transport system permease protein
MLGQWWPTTLPGVMILITLLGLNLMGDGLQSRLDPRLRRR